MPNPFDKFDAKGNPFDRFDADRVPEYVPPGVEGYNPKTGLVEEPAPTGIGGKFGAATGSFIEGMPIVGPLVKKGAQAAAAGMVAPFVDESFGQVYDEMGERDRAAKEANPITSALGGVGGAIAGTLPMVMAAPSAFGAGSGGLLARSLASGASGAAVGGADSAVRSGGDLGDTLTGAAWGGGLGLAGPLAGDLAGRGYQGVKNWVTSRGAAKGAGASDDIVRMLSRAMTDDGMDASAAGARMQELGPDAMLMDLGPNLQRQAGAIAATPGKGQEIVRSAITSRDTGANSRILSALDDTLGKAVVPSQMDDTIRSSQRALSPQYKQALSGAKAVQTQPIADALESEIVNLRGEAQSAVKSVRQMLNIVGTDQLDPDPATLLATRQAIDDMLQSPTLGNNATRVLSEVRQSVDDTLAASVPGIKDIDAQFAELARQRGALERGQTVLDSGRTAPRPQELADEVTQAALPQGTMVGPSAAPVRLREGARAEIDRIVGTNANDRVALQRIIKGEGSWNRDRLATLFGSEKADRIFKVLDTERAFAETSNIVTRNSETAARQAAMQEVGTSPGQTFGMREGYMAGGTMGAARSGAVRVAEKLIDSLISSRADASRSGLATALASRNSNEILSAVAKRMSLPKTSPQTEAVTRVLLLSAGPVAAR